MQAIDPVSADECETGSLFALLRAIALDRERSH